jgi:hypothetical protein
MIYFILSIILIIIVIGGIIVFKATRKRDSSEEVRLNKLKDLEILTDDQMEELGNLLPKGEMKSLPNLLSIGITNLEGYIRNFQEGGNISRRAYKEGFYIETISLRLQLIELYLRMYYVAKNTSGKMIDPELDKRTFGSYINDCKNLGFDSELIDEMIEFNKHRVIVIHKFLMGEVEYSSLKDVCDTTQGLDDRVSKYVINEIGIALNP